MSWGTRGIFMESQTANITTPSAHYESVNTVYRRCAVPVRGIVGCNYDNLYRLTKSALSGDNTCTTANNLAVSYLLNGNINTRSDVDSNNTWTYDGAHLHQVTRAGSSGSAWTYGYDNNGNMTSRNGNTLTWTSYNTPNQINAANSESASFAYGPDRQRWKMTYTNASTS